MTTTRTAAFACCLGLTALGSQVSAGAGHGADNRWYALTDSDTRRIELSYEAVGGRLTLVCSDGGCESSIEPDSGCTPGMSYPLLLNSQHEVALAQSVCIPVESRGSTAAVLMVGVQQRFFTRVFDGESLTIAFPATEGGMDVIDVSTAGLRAALEEARQALAQADGGASSPRPPQGLGENRANVERVLRESRTKHRV